MNSRYIIEVKGKNPLRFLKNLQAKKVYLYQIETHPSSLKIEVDDEGLKTIEKMKTVYEIKVLSYKGLARFKYLFYQYRFFLFSSLVGFLFLIILSSMVWKIEVVHTKEEIRTLLFDALEEKGVRPFTFKISYSKKEKIKEEILEEYKEQLEWLEIEEVGTKYVVRVEERKINQEKEDTTPRNIIAKKDAMILSVQASHGEVVTKRFDYVKKGDVLISGIIHKEEEAKSKVRAEGEVYGEVWYTVSVTLPIMRQEEKVLSKPKNKFLLTLFGKTYSLEDGYYKTLSSYPIFKSGAFPFSLSFGTIQKVKLITTHYDLESGTKEGMRLASEKLKVKLDKNSEVTYQKVLKKEKKGSKIYVEVFFKVKEDIVGYESLENVDLAKEKEEDMR